MSLKQGFTLLELVIALAVIAIVGATATLAFRPTPRRHLQNASLQLQADLRYTQRRAIMEGRRHGIIFDPWQSRYRIMAFNPMEELRVVYLQNGVTLGSSTHNRLTFTPRGTASSGFSILLSSERYSQRLTATVSGGRIEIFPIVP